MNCPGELAQERAPVLGQGVVEPPGGVQRLGDLDQLGGVEPTAAGGPVDRRADVPGAGDAHVGSLGQERPRLGRLLEPALDHDRVGRRLVRLGQAAAGREAGRGSQPGSDQRVLEEGE